MQSRCYDPNTCRFISADVLLSTGQGVIGHNAFAYCGNNPIIRIDSEGICSNTINTGRKLIRNIHKNNSITPGINIGRNRLYANYCY
nr:hypothetical protein [Clostridia bacterium]